MTRIDERLQDALHAEAGRVRDERLSLAVRGGFTIGWIGHGAFHRLPIPQPYLPGDPTLVIAW